MRAQRSNLFLGVMGLAVLVALAAGLNAIGTPEEARMRRLDTQRVNNLRNISNAMENYHRSHENLPASLDQLQQPSGFNGLHLNDPETKQPYEYKPLTQDTYELCAQFQTVQDAGAEERADNPFWHHGAGRHCFALKVKAVARKPG
ncbi:DUF1559 domain-containing protein [Fundidesulfovibrio soli]|uniref:DUF1559 domain-containing protein n=1 Tax=Fundidesulfovibrio soli TaxID=2922716 RepID=UPI001FAF1E26|nr:DUF1559 domain-containing protein [Fundidesulfovibrio soli]